MKTHFLQFTTWIARSFSDSGDVSSRRLTAFAITNIYLFARVMFILRMTDPYFLLLGFLIDAGFILLLFGIVTFQQITEFKNGMVIKEVSKSEVKTETKTEEKTTG